MLIITNRFRSAYNKSQKDIEELKRQLAEAKNEIEKKSVEAGIKADENRLTANEWFETGYKHSLNNEYDKAIEAYRRVISLNPNIFEAYNNRGVRILRKASMTVR